MKDLSKQLVHMDKPFICKWVLGERIVYNTDNGNRVAIVLDSNEFRNMMHVHARIISDMDAAHAKKVAGK